MAPSALQRPVERHGEKRSSKPTLGNLLYFLLKEGWELQPVVPTSPLLLVPEVPPREALDGRLQRRGGGGAPSESVPNEAWPPDLCIPLEK